VYPKLDYDIEKDFVPLMLLANVPQVVVINPKRVQANTIQEFIALVKRNPGKFNYGSAGSGTSHHLAGELFKLQTGTFITHIPYRGAGPALSDLISGNVDLMFDGLGSSAQHIKSGRIKALMVAGSKRNPAFPDVPCAAEVGLPDYTVTTWYGLWAPKGTSADVQARAIDDMKKALATDDLKTIWAQNGSEIPNVTGAAYGSFVNSEIKRWATVVKASGAKLE
jgi:tripartite-type tricarboxylate transporter receptor subunit TctC